MHRFLLPVRSALFLLWPVLAGSGHSGELASGFGLTMTPAERQLAERPQPDGYFREMTGYWHGVPGLEALRARWEGFAKEHHGFAVLAALLSENEGRPEEALQQVQRLPGSGARWNEGRLLALLGRENEAVAVLSALAESEGPELGAAALIALTELDGIRGDFAGALRRTTAAWEARKEEAFRLRILERHLSLLVEAGRERGFVEDQVKAAETTGDEAAAGTAQRVLVVMADWFTEDVRLQEAREKLKSSYSTVVTMMVTGGRPGGTLLRETMECGILRPRGPALELLGQDEAASLETAGSLAYQISFARRWPETLDGQPLLKQAFAAQPLHVAQALFYNPDPVQPLPPLARTLADGMEAGVERRTVDLVERAWAGRAGPEDAETLASIIIEAHQLRRLRSVGVRTQYSMAFSGWPVMMNFPAEKIVWNLSGETWSAYYRSSCRLAPLSVVRNSTFYAGPARLAAWREWRPDWPMAQESALTLWAWKHLTMLEEATTERAAAIGRRIEDPSDRFLFAARCLRMELLSDWCRNEALLQQVNSMALMQAALVLQQNTGPEVMGPDAKMAVIAIAREMARRMNLNALDLIRCLRIFSQHAQPWMKRDMEARPVDQVLAETLGLFTGDPAVRAHWNSRLAQTMPHPLHTLPVSPSVERFRVLTALLRRARESGIRSYDIRSPLQEVVHAFFRGEGPAEARRGIQDLVPNAALVQELARFPTAHPLKRQVLRWEVLSREFRVNEENQRQVPGRPGEPRDVNLLKALQILAAEEQTDLSWHLTRAMLEEAAPRRALLLDLVQARSPLAAGVTESRPAPPGGTVAAPIPAPASAQGLAGQFIKMIADPATRQKLEPAGALPDFVRKDGPYVFLLGLRRAAPGTLAEAAQHLLDAADPLAARMAVTLMARHGQESQAFPWLLKALAIFPDDPELLLAFAARSSRSGKPSDTGPPAFRRGVASLKSLISFDSQDPWSQTIWCGIPEQQTPQDAETASALAEFTGRAQPASLPQKWVAVMESALGNIAELSRMTEAQVRSTAMAVVRYKAPWRLGQGNPSGWVPLLDKLVHAGKKEQAAGVAEALLSQPTGSLGFPSGADEPALPWRNYSNGDVTGRGAEGWKWLQLAGYKDPAGLADRLQAVSMAHPGDEQTALAALLARGIIRPLAAEDVKLTGLAPAGRHRALAYASWLLPPDRLAEALVVESWEAEARVEFSDVSNGDRNFLQGSAYLDRLENAGATQAVRRLLPSFVACLKKIAAGGFETYPSSIVQRLQRLGTPAQLDYFHTLLADHLKEMPDGPQSYGALAATLEAQMEESGLADPPPELARRVTLALESAAAGKPSPWEQHDSPFWEVAFAAAGDPRWHDLLRRLFADQPQSPTPDGTAQPAAKCFPPHECAGFRSRDPGAGTLFFARSVRTRNPEVAHRGTDAAPAQRSGKD